MSTVMGAVGQQLVPHCNSHLLLCSLPSRFLGKIVSLENILLNSLALQGRQKLLAEKQPA